MNNLKSLLIIGAGGHGKVVLELAQLRGDYDNIFFIDDQKKKGDYINGAKVLDTIENIKLYVNEISDCIVAIGDNEQRRKLLTKVERMNYNIPILIHPNSFVSNYTTIAKGTVILANAVVNTDVNIGTGVIINTGAIIEHDCILGDYTHVSYGAIIGSGSKIGDGYFIDLGERVKRNSKIQFE